jgi:hypothetical protein
MNEISSENIQGYIRKMNRGILKAIEEEQFFE